MQILKYILIDCADETGNDDGILDRKKMTALEAEKLNEALNDKKSTRIWIPAAPKKINS